ncbi:hypothetical protein [Trinickia mobilis]|uniref:hypothetical protein n=1 Tax=Trinickia mobilis TaxID=2816356 RepID=UPI001A8EB054|nr:hypothetical protein [Trinickia mobilis]
MSTPAFGRCNGYLSGSGSPPAGEVGRKLIRQAFNAVDDLKAGGAARTSWVFNDLQALAQEHELNFRQAKVMVVAQRFLLALPGTVPAPELSIDGDGEASFDWRGPRGELLTIALREDGRLSYASRMSPFDKDHGTKRFVDVIPKSIIDLVHQVTAG